MQSINLVCEQLSQSTSSIKPFTFVIELLVKHLKLCTEEQRSNLSEEFYEVLGDFCL